MKSARDQDIATGIISLGLLANKLAWVLIDGPSTAPLLPVNESIYNQWKKVLRETIDFIQTPDTSTAGQPQRMVSHFLSRAQYLEQIYIATPGTKNKNWKELATYLETIYQAVDKLDRKEQLDPAKRDILLHFSRSIANQSIQEASKFHQESHMRKTSVSLLE